MHERSIDQKRLSLNVVLHFVYFWYHDRGLGGVQGPDGEPSLIIKVTGLCCGSHRALTDAVYVHCTNMHAHILNTQPGTSLSEIQMRLFSTIQFEDCGQSQRKKDR